MNFLTASYINANRESGHERHCSFGAGGDCNCPASETTRFIVTATFSTPEVFVHYCGPDLDDAKKKARALVANPYTRNVRLRRRVFDADGWEALAALHDRADLDEERMDDWTTD